jgi:uncharacterized protein (TIGR03083 family)
MESKRLLECLDQDYRRLRSVTAGADLAAIVPTCPEWTMADLVRHVGAVYLHKVECLRLGTNPEVWPPPGLNGEEPLALLDRAYAELVAEFTKRGAEAPAFTWYEPDQTVGFWIRRMAQETVIHRVDGELTAGFDLAPIPADLAEDGVDEFLVAFIEFGAKAWLDDFEDVLATADGRSVRIETPDAAWLVRPTPEGIDVRVSDVDSADAVVRADPTDLLLWLWNRMSDDTVAITGDPALVAYLRTVFAAGSG